MRDITKPMTPQHHRRALWVLAWVQAAAVVVLAVAFGLTVLTAAVGPVLPVVCSVLLALLGGQLAWTLHRLTRIPRA
ncbi:hypothetical protein AB1K56_14695 [Microbacterium sp. BWR-S6Y]|uniref:hypothetical protein n=1 Tax=Microbacterium sp. BWR-S6Y TaxID=3232073 RepID=UPI003527B032